MFVDIRNVIYTTSTTVSNTRKTRSKQIWPKNVQKAPTSGARIPTASNCCLKIHELDQMIAKNYEFCSIINNQRLHQFTYFSSSEMMTVMMTMAPTCQFTCSSHPR